MMTEKQKELIDVMNEFCREKLNYDESTTKAEARDYIMRNMENFKLLTMDCWQINYM